MKEPYFLESSLPHRVRKYMDEDRVMHLEIMTEFLMENYPDFKHKKKRPFMKSVEKAYKWELFKQDQRSPESQKKISSSEDSELIEVDKNGQEVDIVELPIKKDTFPKKKSESLVDSMYKSASPLVDKTQTPNSSKSSKRKREANDIDSMIVNEIKRKRNNIEKLTFHYDSSSFQGSQYLPFKVGTIPAFFAGDDWPSLPKSILFAGPMGSGKSMLIECFASTCSVPLLRISTSSMNSGPANNGMSLMKEAISEAIASQPCILHFDNIDEISKKDYGSGRGAERKTCEMIANAIEELNRSSYTVLLIAETRMPEQMDKNVWSKFQNVINLSILCEEAKLLILKKLCEEHGLDIEDINLNDIVERTTSFVAGDLKKLVQQTALESWERDARTSLSKAVVDNPFSKEYKEEYLLKVCKTKRKVLTEDFYNSLTRVTPTLKTEGFPRPSDTKWDDIGGLADIKQQIRRKVVNPIKYKKKYGSFGITDPHGILMYGPPGCGKTLLAEAVANEAGVNLYSVKGPELLNMYQGESERGIREVFEKAARVAPCIIFFDEFDGLCQNRIKSVDSGSRHTIVNTLLAEMNGFGGRKEVYVIAATNVPEVVDPAILRPGRIDLTLYVGLPDLEGRAEIMKSYSRKKGIRLGSDVDLEDIAALCENFSGADCANLVQTACEAALDEVDPDENMGDIEIENNEVCRRHFKVAKTHVAPSVNPEDREKFLRMKSKMEGLRKGKNLP